MSWPVAPGCGCRNCEAARSRGVRPRRSIRRRQREDLENLLLHPAVRGTVLERLVTLRLRRTPREEEAEALLRLLRRHIERYRSARLGTAPGDEGGAS